MSFGWDLINYKYIYVSNGCLKLSWLPNKNTRRVQPTQGRARKLQWNIGRGCWGQVKHVWSLTYDGSWWKYIGRGFGFYFYGHLESMATWLSPTLATQVKQSLSQSLRKNLPRLVARSYISIYEQDSPHNEILLALAKLDFNILQRPTSKGIWKY